MVSVFISLSLLSVFCFLFKETRFIGALGLLTLSYIFPTPSAILAIIFACGYCYYRHSR